MSKVTQNAWQKAKDGAIGVGMTCLVAGLAVGALTTGIAFAAAGYGIASIVASAALGALAFGISWGGNGFFGGGIIGAMYGSLTAPAEGKSSTVQNHPSIDRPQTPRQQYKDQHVSHENEALSSFNINPAIQRQKTTARTL